MTNFAPQKKTIMKMKLNHLLCLGLLSLSAPAFSQETVQTTQEGDMYTLSLEELMNIPIKSASKKEETLFDAPLSSYTITRSDIDKAGSTSIMVLSCITIITIAYCINVKFCQIK